MISLRKMCQLILTISKVCLKQDINHPNYNRSLAGDLRDWYDIKSKLTSGSILTSEYDHWRYNFPADRAAETKRRLDELSSK